MDINVLQKLVYFQQLGPDDLKALAGSVLEVSRQRGEALFHEGEPSRGLYFVMTGAIKISRISPEGREQVVAVVGPCQTFNDVPVFDGGPCPASAIALEPSTVGLIPEELMRRLAVKHPAVAEGMFKVFASRLRGLTTLVADLTQLDVPGRVAKFLLTYHEASGQSSLSFSQQDVASIVGTTREVVARALKTLEERGAIARRGTSVEIVSAQRLAEALEESAR